MKSVKGFFYKKLGMKPTHPADNITDDNAL